AAAHAERAAGGDGRTAGHPRRRDPSAAGSLLRDRHPEPGGPVRHLPAAGLAAGPLPAAFLARLSRCRIRTRAADRHRPPRADRPRSAGPRRTRRARSAPGRRPGPCQRRPVRRCAGAAGPQPQAPGRARGPVAPRRPGAAARRPRLGPAAGPRPRPARGRAGAVHRGRRPPPGTGGRGRPGRRAGQGRAARGAGGLMTQAGGYLARAWALAQSLERPRAPEPLPVAIDRRRVYVLPTRFGMFYAALVVAMLLGALNYNNNPALLLALLLGASGLSSLIATHLQLSGLRLEAVSAEPVAAGQPLAPRLALACSDGRPRRGLRADLDAAQAWTALDPDGRGELVLVLPTTRRGWLQPGRIRLSTTQPLGLARAWSRLWPRQRLLVYPRPEANPPPLPDHAGSVGRGRPDPLGEEPHQLRAYRPGDAPRTIAWKHS